MSQFIKEVVKELLQKPQDLIHTTLVLPGKRPMLFFREEFQRQSNGLILPKMQSIENFISELAGIKLISGVPLLFATYHAYKKSVQAHETFDDFIKWAPTILKDFDDLDSTLLDPDNFFDYLVSVERIKNWGIEEIEVDKNSLLKNHLEFWKVVKSVYFQLKNDLLTHNLAYNGLANRVAKEHLENLYQENHQFIFAGFNALTVAEQKIIFGLEKNGLAKIYWDCDQYYLQEEQESGHFLRQYKQKLSKWNWTFDDFNESKEITVTGISKQVGQAKFVSEILKDKSDEELKKTALILADEALLPAILNALPENIKHINISMGIPLKSIPLAQFFKSVFELQMNREKLGKDQLFYFKNIVQILENSSLKSFQQSIDRELINEIQRNNKIFNSSDYLVNKLKSSKFQSLFTIPKSIQEFISILINFTQKILNDPSLENALTREFLFYFQKIFIQLNNEIEQLDVLTNFRTLNLLYQKLLQSETLSFIGEPLEGLQIMGVLETRLINFDHIIMTSVNDEVLPLGRQNNTFIPYDIRKEKGLNTFTENDSIYAYHFYRLLSRAQQIDLVYNTDPDGMGSGDKSRFIEQMNYESNHQLKFSYAKPHFEIVPQNPLIIQKTPKTMELLNNWVENVGISPSRLVSYLRNPIEFYEQIVLQVEEIEEAEETISAKTLGNIVHKTLEELYKPFLKKILHENDFKQINTEKEAVLLKYFKEEYKDGDIDKGQNLLVRHIALRIVDGVLTKDQKTAKQADFSILELEKKFSYKFDLDGQTIYLKGFVDRIDEVDGIKRIIDYKTGYTTDIKIKSEKLEDVFIDEKYSKVLQLIFYAHLYYHEYQNKNENIQLCIYPIKFPNKEMIKLELDGETTIGFDLVENTKENLENMIREIINPTIPFQEKLN